jgi:ubiquitin fusion degradation protein 1
MVFVMNNFGLRTPGSMAGMSGLANFLSMHQTATRDFSVMSCGSSKIDRGARGWDRGARIFLPPSLLDTILKMQDLGRIPVGEVMLFEVKNRDAVVHVGVQEFIAPEGVCAIPSWMWNQLSIASERQRVTVTQVTLERGGFVKFKPLQPEFMQTHNPKAILEKHLRSFAALTMGMVITIYYGERDPLKRFDLEVRAPYVFI